MRELTMNEMEKTGGGAWPIVAAILAPFLVVYGEDMLDSAIEGFTGQPQT